MTPRSVRDLIQRTATTPCQPPRTDYPYRRYYRSVAAILLSGRVRNTAKGSPNQTDMNRLCQEAHFNAHALQLYSAVLLHMEVIVPRGERYLRGRNFDRFFSSAPADLPGLRELTRRGIGVMVAHHTPHRVRRPTAAEDAHLDVLLLMLCAALPGLGVRESGFTDLLRALAGLPPQDLLAFARDCGQQGLYEHHVLAWAHDWLDEPGIGALWAAVCSLGFFTHTQKAKVNYTMPSHTGLVMLGLEEPTQTATPVTTLTAQSDYSILAGEDLPFSTLVPLFRGCRVRRIDRVIQFHLDVRHLTAVPGPRTAADELLEVLQPLAPLPNTIACLLHGQPPPGGTVAVRACSGLVRVDDPGLLEAIRNSDKLKGYVDRLGPPGYLIIKSSSSLEAFVHRCQLFGYHVESL